jgi:hypothetical protein
MIRCQHSCILLLIECVCTRFLTIFDANSLVVVEKTERDEEIPQASKRGLGLFNSTSNALP